MNFKWTYEYYKYNLYNVIELLFVDLLVFLNPLNFLIYFNILVFLKYFILCILNYLIFLLKYLNLLWIIWVIINYLIFAFVPPIHFQSLHFFNFPPSLPHFLVVTTKKKSEVEHWSVTFHSRTKNCESMVSRW